MKVLLIDQIAKVNFRYTYPLINGLMHNGVNVDLVMDLKSENENCQCRKFRWFVTDEKNVGKLDKIKNYISSYKKILELVKKERYDVVQTEWFILSPIDYFFLRKIKKASKAKLVVTVHDILPFNEKFYDRFFHGKLYTLADSIIVQAPGNRSRFTQLFPQCADKVQMIPHGHMLDYVETYDRELSRTKLNIADDELVLLFFGQIKKVKGVDLLLKAFALVKDKYPKLHLIIAGSVWKADFSECQAIIDASDFGNSLTLDIRYIPDDEVKVFYSAADACVLPYTDVYQSGVIQLSYGYKKAVIASDLSSFTQFVKEGETGFLAKVGDVESLAGAIERFVSERSRLFEIGEAGYNLVKNNLNWNVLTKEMIASCY